MKIKPELVLDMAGVLATNFSPLFWEYLSETYNQDYNELLEFRKTIREELWTGEISEVTFWRRLERRIPKFHVETVRNQLLAGIVILPAIHEIPNWSAMANIHLISNHRNEWIDHIISPIKDYITSVTISADIGYCKPNIEIYEKTQGHFKVGSKVLFIDDQEKNLIGALPFNWNTLLADPKGSWIKQVSPRLIELASER